MRPMDDPALLFADLATAVPGEQARVLPAPHDGTSPDEGPITCELLPWVEASAALLASATSLQKLAAGRHLCISSRNTLRDFSLAATAAQAPAESPRAGRNQVDPSAPLSQTLRQLSSIASAAKAAQYKGEFDTALAQLLRLAATLATWHSMLNDAGQGAAEPHAAACP